MNTICDDLRRRTPMVSDGAWGTFLVSKGMQPGECPELWNVSHREAVLDIARSYVAAGADMITTNSFGASPIKLKAYGLAERAAELNEAAAAISRQAAGDRVHVIASIGPTGKILMMGDVTEEELYEGFALQARAFERGGADACCIETMTAVDEASLAIKAVKENTSLEVLCTFTFDRIATGAYRTMMGVSPTAMAEATLAAGANVIGTNCGQGITHMLEIVEEMRAAAPTTPILAQPNAGMPVRVNDVDQFPESPEAMASLVIKLVAAGATIIGGCCGTSPAHIRAIAEALGT